MYAAAANLVCCFEIMMSMQERLANASKLEEFFVGKDYNSSLALSHWLQSYFPMSWWSPCKFILQITPEFCINFPVGDLSEWKTHMQWYEPRSPWGYQTKSSFLIGKSDALRPAHTEDAGIIWDSACRQGALAGRRKWDGEQRISIAYPQKPSGPCSDLQSTWNACHSSLSLWQGRITTAGSQKAWSEAQMFAYIMFF